MYLFEISENEKAIYKSEVEFEREEIITIRSEIIENCSNIVHRKRRGTRNAVKEDGERYRSVQKRFAGTENEIDIYDFTYTEYVFPELVSWLDKLLEGDISAINHLVGKDAKVETVSYDDIIEEARANVDAIDTMNYEDKIKALNNLKEIVENSKLNEGNKSTKPYLERLKSLITVTKCATLPLESIDRVLTFFDKTPDDFGLTALLQTKDKPKSEDKRIQLNSDPK